VSIGIVEHLVEIVHRVTDGRVPLDVDPNGPDSLRRLGLDSLAMLEFLVGVEDEFGLDWGDDVPPDTLASFSSIADHIQEMVTPC
jgi:acyl carrier protein